MHDNDEGIVAQTGETQSGWNWREWHVVYIVTPVVFLLLLVSQGLLCYSCGRLGRRMTDLVCMLYPAVAGLLVFCFSASIIRLLVHWAKHTWRIRLLIAAEIVIPVAVAFLCVAPIFTPVRSALPPPGVAFLHGFADRVRSRADIPAIRNWMKTLNKGDYVRRRDYYHSDKLPEAFKGLGLGGIFLSEDENGNPKVNFAAGGGFHHWGGIIGLRGLVIPESDINHYDAWLLVEPGVYVYAW